MPNLDPSDQNIEPIYLRDSIERYSFMASGQDLETSTQHTTMCFLRWDYFILAQSPTEHHIKGSC